MSAACVVAPDRVEQLEGRPLPRRVLADALRFRAHAVVRARVEVPRAAGAQVEREARTRALRQHARAAHVEREHPHAQARPPRARRSPRRPRPSRRARASRGRGSASRGSCPARPRRPCAGPARAGPAAFSIRTYSKIPHGALAGQSLTQNCRPCRCLKPHSRGMRRTVYRDHLGASSAALAPARRNREDSTASGGEHEPGLDVSGLRPGCCDPRPIHVRRARRFTRSGLDGHPRVREEPGPDRRRPRRAGPRGAEDDVGALGALQPSGRDARAPRGRRRARTCPWARARVPTTGSAPATAVRARRSAATATSTSCTRSTSCCPTSAPPRRPSWRRR